MRCFDRGSSMPPEFGWGWHGELAARCPGPTLRGFEQNTVGPIGPDLIPNGGDALFVLNNELRVPLYWIIDGVVFADIGNVFNRISDFSITNLRESGGIGLRVRTPWFLIRGDYGVVLDRRPGEPRSRFYFSIGQAF